MIGLKIRELRVARRMTQEALARRLNISGQAVSKWEQGLTSPDISLLPELSDALGVGLDELLGHRAGAYNSRREELLAIYEASGAEEDFARAAEAYRAALLDGEPAPGDYAAYAFLHERRVRRDIGIAIRYYRLEIEKAEAARVQDWIDARLQLITMLSGVGRAGEAVRECLELVAREPENAHYRMFAAYALRKKGDDAEAYEQIRRAEATCPHVSVYTIAGGICRALGRFDEAFAYWDKAYEIDPGYCAALYAKADAYEAMGEPEKAIAEYEGILEWHAREGFTLGVEDAFARERIELLKEKLAKRT